MSNWPGPKTFLYRRLGIKPIPLRQASNGPFIFIHINKTAGTSIGRAIGLPVKDHLTATEVIARIGLDKWNSAYKFTVVRNPWDKVVSHYDYRRKKNKTEIASRNISFSDWVIMTYGDIKNTFYFPVLIAQFYYKSSIFFTFRILAHLPHFRIFNGVS